MAWRDIIKARGYGNDEAWRMHGGIIKHQDERYQLLFHTHDMPSKTLCSARGEKAYLRVKVKEVTDARDDKKAGMRFCSRRE